MNDTQDWVWIERDVDAPVETDWKMWTDPTLFKTWYGPMGFSVPEAAVNPVVGGRRKICLRMTAPERTVEVWFTGVHKEVSAPRRLRYTESMCDADGNILSPEAAGMPPGSPESTEVMVELAARGAKTRMTMTHIGVPAGSPGEGGWMQAFDKLAAAAAA